MSEVEKLNILLVDDRVDGLVALEAVLVNPGYNLVRALSGREALTQVLKYDFALILMDVQMPEMDGFETAAIIKQRERSKNIPIIFLTALNKADSFVSRGYTMGAVDYIFKPFDPHILKSKVAVFVDLHRKTQTLQMQSAVLRDIERQDRLRTLNELESVGRRRYQNLADAIPQIVFRATGEGKVEYFNQFWRIYTGLQLKESEGEVWKLVLHPKELEEFSKRWQEARVSQVGFEFECRLRRGQSGEYRWHLLRVVPEFDQSSRPPNWIGTATEIHEQKMNQQELEVAKALADAASKTKSRFLSNMSHEIRTPLGVILGFAELMMNPQIGADERMEAIAAIRRNGEQLSRIIDEILDLSKVEAGKMEVEIAELNLPELLCGVRSFMSLSAREKKLAMDFRIEGAVPEKIKSSAARLQQILVNVIGNAIKFSSHGEISVTVEYVSSATSQTPTLNIRVKDNGVGLTQAQAKNLFQPFTQADSSTTRKFGGTGLGLILSKNLARLLGGDVVIEKTAPGMGSTFCISIEAGEVPNTAMVSDLKANEVLENQKAWTQERKLDGVKVLLVEDSVENQFLVKRFLSMEGASVELANNGLEGVEKAVEGNHDVVLMDIQMPELDGYEAIARLRGRGFVKPIIALTAYGMHEERLRCLKVGSNEHMVKPINRMALVEQVRVFAQIANS